MKKIKKLVCVAVDWGWPLLRTGLNWLLKASLVVLRILLYVLITVSAITFLTVPFFNSFMSVKLAQWLWYPATVLLLFPVIIYCKREKTPSNDPPVIEHLGKWGVFSFIFAWLSIFVFNYYDFDLFWKWVIFGVAAVYLPAFLISLLLFDWKHNDRDQKDRQAASLRTVKNIFLCLFYDLLYMSFFNNWLIPSFVFGILVLLIVTFNLVDAFLNGAKSLRFFIALELILGLIVVAYLIFLIPNDTVQGIVLTIISALLGGAFTLLGVAWTIKKGDADRQAELRRIEEERRDETRKKYTPYIMPDFAVIATNAARVQRTNDLDFTKAEDVDRIQDDTYYVNKINCFTIRNVSASNILVKGIYFNGNYHEFCFDTLVESNGVCQIQVGINHWFAFPEKIDSIRLLVADILNNEYTVECLFSAALDQHPQKETHNGIEYLVYSYTYSVEGISLPVLQQ